MEGKAAVTHIALDDLYASLSLINHSTKMLSRQIPATVRQLSRTSQIVRCASTATAPTTTGSSASPAPLANIEASWKGLSPAEQEATFKSLEELQKKDWNELSIDEKKAAYYVAFGPHGPREPVLAPGSGAKTIMGVGLSIVAALGLFAAVRTLAQEKPKTLTREWQEASTEMAKEQRMDPFTGPASEGYKGKGFVNNK